jgi:4-amino-4-deoxy-L-arabinose transferase-like glycosyltransferase
VSTAPKASEAGVVRRPGARLAALILSLWFILEGLVFIPYVGLQADEAIFSGVIYPPFLLAHATRFFGLLRHHPFPTMLMSYLGTLKAIIFKLIFAVFGASIWTVRVPVLIFGALTVLLFFVFVRRVAGTPAALASAALLATDASFVMTTCMDWGPVALQHLLLVGGLLALWYFHQTGRARFLAAGFFIFGLALWDKALFVWMFAGLAAAAMAVFPRQLLSRLTRRNLAVAVLSLLAGAAPLVAFNLRWRLETFRGNTRLSAADLGSKARALEATLNGAGLFGYMVRQGPPVPFEPPRSAMESVSIGVSEACGQRQTSFFPFACLAALVLLPWLWATPARKPMLFALIAMAVAWLQMLFTYNAGGSAHHAVLLWPLPHLFAGVGLAQGSRMLRRAGPAALIAILVVVCGSNLVVLNQYLAQFIEYGPTTVWTDAIGPLSAYLRTSPARRIYEVDWGILPSLRILNAGQLPLEPLPDQRTANAKDRAAALEAVASKDAVFLSHTEGNEAFPGINAALDAVARSAGYRPQVLKVIADRFNRPIFQVYRYVRSD